MAQVNGRGSAAHVQAQHTPSVKSGRGLSNAVPVGNGDESLSAGQSTSASGRKYTRIQHESDQDVEQAFEQVKTVKTQNEGSKRPRSYSDSEVANRTPEARPCCRITKEKVIAFLKTAAKVLAVITFVGTAATFAPFVGGVLASTIAIAIAIKVTLLIASAVTFALLHRSDAKSDTAPKADTKKEVENQKSTETEDAEATEQAEDAGEAENAEETETTVKNSKKDKKVSRDCCLSKCYPFASLSKKASKGGKTSTEEEQGSEGSGRNSRRQRNSSSQSPTPEREHADRSRGKGQTKMTGHTGSLSSAYNPDGYDPE
jgi:hypothetical protein